MSHAAIRLPQVYTIVLLLVVFLQDIILAFMMGTHARVGQDSQVLELDVSIAEFIARNLIAEKWLVALWLLQAGAATHADVVR